LAAEAIAKEFYINAMEQHCGGDRPYMHPQHLQVANSQIRDESLKRFMRYVMLCGWFYFVFFKIKYKFIFLFFLLINFFKFSMSEPILCDSRVQPWHRGPIKLAKLTEASVFCNGSISDIELLQKTIRFKCCWMNGPDTGLKPEDLGSEPDNKPDTNNNSYTFNESTKRLIIKMLLKQV
jgi:hypothetical protein